MDVTDDPDDGGAIGFSPVTHGDGPTNRIGPGRPEFTRRRLADHGNGRSAGTIARVEHASSPQWNTQRREYPVAGADDIRRWFEIRDAVLRLHAGGGRRRERQSAGHRGAADAVDRADPLEGTLVELTLSADIAIASRRQREVDGDDLQRIESHTHLRHRHERARQEAGPREERQRERDLRGHEPAAQARGAGDEIPAAKRTHWIAQRGSKRGYGSEDDR